MTNDRDLKSSFTPTHQIKLTLAQATTVLETVPSRASRTASPDFNTLIPIVATLVAASNNAIATRVQY